MGDKSEASEATIDHATCLACGSLCDDITLTVQAGRITEADRACTIGRPWFLEPHPGSGLRLATIDGQAADLEAALDRAAALLLAARSPFVWGLAGATIEAQRVAVAIADRLGAAIDPSGSHPARLRAFQRAGQVSSTLGEVKDRADVVVYWGVDPASTHPRLGERYALEPASRFLPRGRPDRTLIVVDDRSTPSARLADLQFAIHPDRRASALWALRALVQGLALDPLVAAEAAGLPSSDLQDLADQLTRARFGALFFDPAADSFEIEGLLTLVRDLNQGRRFVALSLGSAGNAAGAESVLAWQSGFPAAVDFALGHPRHLPGDASLAARLASRSIDVALIVMDDPPGPIGEIPTIVIVPGATGLAPAPAVAFNVARMGIEDGGTVARSDGVMLPVRPALDSSLPPARSILEAIAGRLISIDR